MMSRIHFRPALQHESKKTRQRGRGQVNAGGFTVRQGMIELLSRTTGLRNTVQCVVIDCLEAFSPAAPLSGHRSELNYAVSVNGYTRRHWPQASFDKIHDLHRRHRYTTCPCPLS